MHNGKMVPIASTTGTFYLEWREGKKRIPRAVGNRPREAKDALALQLYTLTLRDQGVKTDDAPQIAERRREDPAGKTIVGAINDIKKNPPPISDAPP